MRLYEDNAYNIALYEIERRNYNVVYINEDGFKEWRATKGDISVFAFTPLTLLALVVVADTYGENWGNTVDEDIHERVMFNDDI